MTEPVSVGPWIGQDDVNRPTSSGFQVGRERKAARSLVNVDVHDDGWVSRRKAFVEKVVFSDPKGAYPAFGYLFVQDGGRIVRVDSSFNPVVLVSGLNPSKRVEFIKSGNNVYWGNGEARGRLTREGLSAGWGMPQAPKPGLGTAPGLLRAGRYMVSVTWVDAWGVESTTEGAAVIELLAPAAITVDLVPPADAVSARIWCTRVNGRDLFWVADILAGNFPYTIASNEVSAEPLRTQHLVPPPLGDCLFTYRGAVMVGFEDVVFSSVGPAHHWFDLNATHEGRPGKVLAGVGLDTGFWTITGDGAFWTVGDVPMNWVTFPRGRRQFAKGGVAVSGGRFPNLQTSDDVALFMSEDGLAMGLPDGNLIFPMGERRYLDVKGKRVDFSWRRMPDWPKSGRLEQLIYSLTVN